MEEFRIIYRILSILRKAMYTEEFDRSLISPEALRVNEHAWDAIMRMLVKEGYIEGVNVISYDQSPTPIIRLTDPRITLKGMQYLEENSMMQRAKGLANGIIEVVKR